MNIADESDASPIWFIWLGNWEMESFAAIFNDLEDPRCGNAVDYKLTKPSLRWSLRIPVRRRVIHGYGLCS